MVPANTGNEDPVRPELEYLELHGSARTPGREVGVSFHKDGQGVYRRIDQPYLDVSSALRRAGWAYSHGGGSGAIYRRLKESTRDIDDAL